MISFCNNLFAVILLFSSITNIIDDGKRARLLFSIKKILVSKNPIIEIILKLVVLIEGIIGLIYFMGIKLKLTCIIASTLFFLIGVFVIVLIKNEKKCKCEDKSKAMLVIAIKYFRLLTLSVSTLIFNAFSSHVNTIRELFFIILLILVYQLILEAFRLLNLYLVKESISI